MTSTTIPTVDPSAVAALKQQHHATWADGDYAVIAETINVALPEAALAGLELAGCDLLDVATGTGNAALLAAQRGANVTGLDLVDDLLDVARDRADRAGLRATFECGDCEALPYADDAFDVVTSTVGVQFAPRAEVVASELLRVCKPGGRIVLVNWSKEGQIGQLFSVMGRYMPAPPAWVSGPPKWGDEDFVRNLFAGCEVTVSRGNNPWHYPTVEGFMDFFEVNYGPMKRAKARLTAEGSWDALRSDIAELYHRLNQATDGTAHFESEFLCVTIEPGA